ncbi:MAG: hypothetical protein JW965_00695 [Bacteroidales bacterium]|nr:hypothetical protein [Bacteroidales bacterium]
MNFEDRYFRFEESIRNLIVKYSFVYSRIRAHKRRRCIIKYYGTAVIDRKLKKRIKQYARQKFGTKSYWPYLALYTEMRREFVEGWLPYDYYRYVLLPKMNPKNYRYLSDAKTYDYRLFGEFAIKPLFVYVSGIFYNADLETINISELTNILAEFDDTIVVKEEFGMKGKQIQIIHSSEFEPEKLSKNINYVIQPYVRQYKVLNDLHPQSLNSFRVTTYLKDNGEVDLIFVILRFGVDGSRLDNLSIGGEYLYFDSSGKPSETSYYGDMWCYKGGVRHKNTGFLFSDINLPMFGKMLDECKKAHKKYPYLRLIGWDVCIDETGDPKLVEWNAICPGFWPFEALFGPLWKEHIEIFPGENEN